MWHLKTGNLLCDMHLWESRMAATVKMVFWTSSGPTFTIQLYTYSSQIPQN